MHQEVTSPSPSSRKKILVPKSYRRTPGMHCTCRSSEFQRNSFSSRCRFLQRLSSISPVTAVAPGSLFPLLLQSAAHSFVRAPSSVVMCLADAGSFCGGRATRGGQQGPAPPFGAIQHRPSHPKPLRGCPLACARCGTVAVA